ncbi:5'-methylthioadenosine/S-adenosylhomocysteine nucleosidase [Methylobacterium crusticola]|uniref:5'-methylthioadenosine/S-adenosylhomocysteine nucleosidase n=1 Tax=Methylobacterium crusticola TaxID=1697972 RepID=A0ABQ4QXU4_9HYPH|nr:phosphorylase [Methylobacterium crusticola]GJD49387.1 5'-methylthioadenosine/S-adenosylhomocysteine nucleosidase [Methylobacterium crusticola]
MIVVEENHGPAPHPVLAVTGLAREARLAAGPGVATVGAGGNPERLRHLLSARTPPGCRAVISIGIAGGLDPGLAPGDVVVATGIVTPARRFGAHPQVARILAQRLAAAPMRVVSADLAGVDAAILSPLAKAALRSESGAAAVDMESHVAAAFAEAHGLPFCALRVVCDPADRALPAAIAKALKPDGEPDLLAVLSALARRSASLGGLVRLARDSSAAFASLGRCRALLGVGLGVPDLGELLRDVA